MRSEEKCKVLIGKESIPELRELLHTPKDRRILLICDDIVEQNCLQKFVNDVMKGNQPLLIKVENGEESKSTNTAVLIWKQLIKQNVRKHDVVVNLGGGMITDLGAFSSSLFKRGIPFINVPTTLLGMVDAAYGGKTAVNLDGIKNQIGNYSWPEAVFIYSDFLGSLNNNEIRGGLAEMLKAGLIADQKLWDDLSNLDKSETPNEEQIVMSLNVKVDVVNKDPFETGLRKILNFGHTFGHAIESHSAAIGKPLSHGEAVALGLLFESYLSSKILALKHIELIKIRDIIFKNFSHLNFDDYSLPEIVSLMRYDKKNVTGINFTLLEGIGRAKIDNYVSEELIKEAFEFCKSHYNTEEIAAK